MVFWLKTSYLSNASDFVEKKQDSLKGEPTIDVKDYESLRRKPEKANVKLWSVHKSVEDLKHEGCEDIQEFLDFCR